MTELRLIAKDPACLSEATCPAILTDDERVLVVGVPTVLPDDAPAGVGPGEAVVAIPADLLDQALAAAGRQIAYRIRAELVCCRIFHRVQAGQAKHPEDGGSSHTICYWGEAAALIAETPDQWRGDPSDHDWSQPDLEERRQARERRNG